MIVNGNCLNLIALLCISSVDENINIHLQLIKKDIRHLLKLMLESISLFSYKNFFRIKGSH